MIIDDLDIDRPGGSVRPFETYAPLVVDANAVLPLAVALQALEAISGKNREVLQRGCGLKLIELQLGLPRKTRERLDVLPVGEVARADATEEKLGLMMAGVSPVAERVSVSPNNETLTRSATDKK